MLNYILHFKIKHLLNFLLKIWQQARALSTFNESYEEFTQQQSESAQNDEHVGPNDQYDAEVFAAFELTPTIRPEYQIGEHEGMHEVDILDENEEDKDVRDTTSDDDHSLEMNQNAIEHPSEVHIEQNQQLNTEVSKFSSLKKIPFHRFLQYLCVLTHTIRQN